MESIILAGGKGMRLRSVVSDVPKPMALVHNKPFLSYVLDWLYDNGVRRTVLAVSYMSDLVVNYFGNQYKDIEICYSHEIEPLGTGGAIKQALSLCHENHVTVVNGDTLFKIDLKKMTPLHDTIVVTACRYVADASRYGLVTIDNEKITAISEKSQGSSGYINGGIYLIERNLLKDYPVNFSFEIDALPNLAKLGKVSAAVFDDYFIDIGIPDDYTKAQYEL